MRLVLDKIDEMNPGNLKLKQFAGDLANTLKSTYENKIRPAVTGGTQGAGHGGASFFESLGLSGLAKSYKDKAEAKENKRQEKEKFVGDFQKYSSAGQTLSADTSRQVAESLFEDMKKMKDELASLEEEGKKRQEAGYGVDPENKKKQEELLAALQAMNPAAKEDGARDQSIQQVQGEEKAGELAATSAKSLELETKESSDLTALYTITDDFFKKQDKRTEEMLECLKFLTNVDYGGGGGGLLGSAAEMAGDLLGGKKGGAAGKAGKVASAAGKLGKFAKIGGGVLAVGTAAYEGYNEYQDAQGAVDRGEITKEQGQVKKGEAVGGGVGGAGGALAGAAAGAAIGSVVPVVGTAIGGIIGGALGYWGGKKAGQAVGGTAVEGYQKVTGATPTNGAGNIEYDAMGNPTGSVSAAPAASAPAAKSSAAAPTSKTVTEQYEVLADEKVVPGKPLSAKQVAVVDMSISMGNKPSPTIKAAYDLAKKAMQPVPQTAPSMAGAELKSANTQLENTKDAVAANNNSTANTVVNAPVTNVSNTNNNGDSSKVKNTKNNDNTFNRYMQARYYPARDF